MTVNRINTKGGPVKLLKAKKVILSNF